MQPEADSAIRKQPATADLVSFLLAGGADRALLLVANDGRILEAHGAAAEIFGGANELRGMNLGALVPAGAPAPAAKPRRLLEQILGGRHVRRRCWCQRPDRSRFWAEIIAAPI